jgi:dipeptidyl aminopeptidase/acylaminoacyl peptidase
MIRGLLGMLLYTTTLVGLADEAAYRLPPPEVADIITARPEPTVSISPDGHWLLLVERDALPGIEDLSRRKLSLAGIRIDPLTAGPFRSEFGRGIALRRRQDGLQTRLALPPDARVAWTHWSHDSRRFAYALATESGTQLWVATVNDPENPRLLTERLSTILGRVAWMPDGKTLACRLTPVSRGSEPPLPSRPLGPNIQESDGNISPTRTFQDLLATPYDEALFEHHATTQLTLIDEQGQQRPLGQPAMVAGIEPSPDGLHLLVTTVKRPFSYTLPYSSFPKEIAVWSVEGKREHLVADVPMEENIPIEGVRTGPRRIGWTSSDPATLAWFEALDGGDPRAKAEHRDRVMMVAAPFATAPQQIVRVEHRAVDVSYFTDPDLLAVTDYDRDRRWVRTSLYHRRATSQAPKTLEDRSLRDRYGDPGNIVIERNAQGHAIARQDGDWIYRAGAGASPAGLLPFLDRQSLATLETQRLWRCEPGVLERAVAIVESATEAKPQVITRQESPTSPPNYLLRDLQQAASQPLTDFPDPTPQIRSIRKELVTYQRADGVPLSATLYLPAGYRPGTRLPLFIWAYPQEFSDAGTAGQVSASPAQFTRMLGASHLSLLTQGYAVLDNATMPVVGDPETMNDTFVEQIVSSAQAAIDKAVEMGVADRQRVAVGGHSYGAFMTANLLAHCNLFRAGIARSGAYNRTLTPFGFQAERRPLWQAKQTYIKLSPFMHADQIKTPLLLIHGEDDDNSGTFPVQSLRLFQAIKGNGGTVRLVMLPHESHGYAARESVLHTQAETIDWLNRYVRDAKIQ